MRSGGGAIVLAPPGDRLARGVEDARAAPGLHFAGQDEEERAAIVLLPRHASGDACGRCIEPDFDGGDVPAHFTQVVGEMLGEALGKLALQCLGAPERGGIECRDEQEHDSGEAERGAPGGEQAGDGQGGDERVRPELCAGGELDAPHRSAEGNAQRPFLSGRKTNRRRESDGDPGKPHAVIVDYEAVLSAAG